MGRDYKMQSIIRGKSRGRGNEKKKRKLDVIELKTLKSKTFQVKNWFIDGEPNYKNENQIMEW